ncbi:MAG: hypothetical protein EBU52_01875 [Cytophagia bacterium]|nr:hypothetical protein [Cytophagia bacterium]
MVMPKRIKRTLQFIAAFFVLLFVLLAVSIAPIDRTPIEQQPFYQASHQAVDQLEIQHTDGHDSLQIGWATVSITPDHAMPMAGYRPRDRFEDVHDSLFTRVLLMDNGSAKIAMISVDLLLFPPALYQTLKQALQGKVDFMYVSATHTHNGVGAFDPTMGGEIVSGDYDPAWILHLSEMIQDAVQQADQQKMNATIAYGENYALDLVSNRLRRSGQKDGLLRSMLIKRADSSTGIFFTFSAHANSINKTSLSLSGDYPGQVIEKLQHSGIDFGMYMAGMVGSHRTEYKMYRLDNFPLLDTFSRVLTKRLLNTQYQPLDDKSSISFGEVPITFGPAQMRLLNNWRVRPWLFNAVFNPLQGNLTYLKIGNITMVGTPCDFSGELYLNHLKSYEDPLMITSFNGSYVGYITEDKAYDEIDKPEVMNMNWVGPYHGQFMAALIEKLINKEK